MSILSALFNSVFGGDESVLLANQFALRDASIAANVSAISQTITNGDTTHAPSGAALFSALALKNNAAFTPSVSGNWSPAPTTIQGALDQLAARVKALEP